MQRAKLAQQQKQPCMGDWAHKPGAKPYGRGAGAQM
jgi:hypothetical protein